MSTPTNTNDRGRGYAAPENLRPLAGREVTVYSNGTYTTGILDDAWRWHIPGHLAIRLSGSAGVCAMVLPDDQPWRVEHLSEDTHIVYTHTVTIGGAA